MKISALASITEVSVPTLKYYLREGLLPAGSSTSRTQSEYSDEHVQRVRLIKALTGVGGLSVSAARDVLHSLDHPDLDTLGLMAAAQRSLYDDGAEVEPQGRIPPPLRVPPDAPTARRWVAARGWRVVPDAPVLDAFDEALAACEAADIALSNEFLDAWGDAVELIATTDLDDVAPDPETALRQVVLGTVLLEPVLLAMRRVAQQHMFFLRQAGPRPSEGEPTGDESPPVTDPDRPPTDT